MSVLHRHSLLSARIGPVTAVAAFKATPEERQAAHPRHEARQILRGLIAESGDTHLRTLAAMVGESAPSATSLRVLTDRVTTAIDRGFLLLVPGWSWRPRPAPLEMLVPPEPAIPPPSRTARTKKTSFEVIIIDKQSGQPLVDLALDITSPDGSSRQVSTNGQGAAKVPDLEPGSCSIRSVVDGAQVRNSYIVADLGARFLPEPASNARPLAGPAFLVEVDRHRIRSGETPSSIAKKQGVPWEDIALFNWGTTDPDELDLRYRDTLGCLRKTPDGASVVFDDRDEPGVVLVPRPFEATLAVGPVHRVLVSPLRSVFLKLENDAGLSLPGVGYEAQFADGTWRRGRLGRSGVARVEGVAEGAFSVSYPDELEVLATSLAACVRKAFDEQVTAPLFTLLMQDQEVVDRASAVYTRSFNDLTGKGLAADIDQVVTDPEARRPLLALCAMAGLAVAGAETLALESVPPTPSSR